MNHGMKALTALLFYAVLSIWVEERWAWSLFQLGVFALAGWRVLQPRRIRAHVALVPLAAAAAWGFLQVLFGSSVSPGITQDAALNWLTFLLVFALACDLPEAAAGSRSFLCAVSVFGMALAAASTLQNYSSGGKIFWLFASGFTGDVMGPFANHNQFAAWVELLFPGALYLALTQERLRPVCGASAAAMFGAVVASTSRTGFVLVTGEALAVAVAVAARRRAPRRALGAAALQITILAVAATAVAGWQGLESRLQARGPESVRVDAVKASIRMAEERPWTGSGLGTWSIVYPRHAGFDAGVFVNQAHNDWVQWAAEGGLPFLFFLAGFAALLWKPATRSIYGVGSVAFLLHAFVDYPMQQRPALAAWFFAMAGVAAAWRNGPARKP